MKYRPEEVKWKMDMGYSMKKKTVMGGKEEEEGVGEGSMSR